MFILLIFLLSNHCKQNNLKFEAHGLLQKLLSDHSEITFSFRVIQEVTWLEFCVSRSGNGTDGLHSFHYIFAALSWNGSVTVLITT